MKKSKEFNLIVENINDQELANVNGGNLYKFIPVLGPYLWLGDEARSFVTGFKNGYKKAYKK